MCTHTHSYADERIQTLLRLDRLTPQPLPKIEMKGFFSEVINMGIIKPPDIESYWKYSNVIYSQLTDLSLLPTGQGHCHQRREKRSQVRKEALAPRVFRGPCVLVNGGS